MQTEVSSDPFKTKPLVAEFDLAKTLGWVARTQGKSAFRQLAEIARLTLPPRWMKPQEYYKFALFRPRFDAAERKTFLSDYGSDNLNRRLAPAPKKLNVLLSNKVLTSHVLEAAGFPVVPITAYFSAEGGMPGRPALADAADIAAYLRRPGTLPIFGKPMRSSMGLGGASYIALEEGMIRLGDGALFTPEAIAAAIARNYPQGYIFQPVIRPHPDVGAITGPTTGVLRVVTLWEQGGPQLLYVVQKLPGPGAMIDSNMSVPTSGFAAVEATTGRILRMQVRKHMNTKATETSPTTGIPLIGRVLPGVAESVALAREAHRLFPSHGLLGFDIPMTETGPVVLEINTNPFHVLYQRAFDRGLMNSDFKPRIEATLADLPRRLADTSA